MANTRAPPQLVFFTIFWPQKLHQGSTYCLHSSHSWWFGTNQAGTKWPGHQPVEVELSQRLIWRFMHAIQEVHVNRWRFEAFKGGFVTVESMKQMMLKVINLELFGDRKISEYKPRNSCWNTIAWNWCEVDFFWKSCGMEVPCFTPGLCCSFHEHLRCTNEYSTIPPYVIRCHQVYGWVWWVVQLWTDIFVGAPWEVVEPRKTETMSLLYMNVYVFIYIYRYIFVFYIYILICIHMHPFACF